MSKHEWRWKGPVGAAHAEAFAEEIYLVLDAAHDPHMNGQWSTGSYSGDHPEVIEQDLLPRLLDFMRLLVMASKPSGGIPFNEPLCGNDAEKVAENAPESIAPKQ
jgi:hypothetical protein